MPSITKGEDDIRTRRKRTEGHRVPDDERWGGSMRCDSHRLLLSHRGLWLDQAGHLFVILTSWTLSWTLMGLFLRFL